MEWLTERLAEINSRTATIGLMGGAAGVEYFANNPIMQIVAYILMALMALGYITPDKEQA